jgi:hypothetical protein
MAARIQCKLCLAAPAPKIKLQRADATWVLTTSTAPLTPAKAGGYVCVDTKACATRMAKARCKARYTAGGKK